MEMDKQIKKFFLFLFNDHHFKVKNQAILQRT